VGEHETDSVLELRAALIVSPGEALHGERPRAVLVKIPGGHSTAFGMVEGILRGSPYFSMGPWLFA
jgi:hypothetical protein